MHNRHARLLLGLTRKSFKVPPKGVGLKTVFAARDAGLILTDETGSPPKCKLTGRGYQERKSIIEIG
jgi:hypothetical protein